MSPSAAEKYLLSDLTWPEVNEAVAMKKVILLSIGTIEQHGHHLPLDVDNVLSSKVCLEAARRAPEKTFRRGSRHEVPAAPARRAGASLRAGRQASSRDPGVPLQYFSARRDR